MANRSKISPKLDTRTLQVQVQYKYTTGTGTYKYSRIDTVRTQYRRLSTGIAILVLGTRTGRLKISTNNSQHRYVNGIQYEYRHVLVPVEYVQAYR